MAATRLRADTEVLEATDAELVRAGSAGNRDVFAELYRRHAPAAGRVARAVAADDHDAADAAAEAFTRVFDAIVSGRAPEMEFRAYLIVATRNAAIDQRRRADRPGLEQAEGVPVGGGAANRRGPSEHLTAGEDSQLVAQAFRGLPARWQSVLWLTEVEGVPAREAADVLGLSANNVSQLAVRARARLRERYLQAHVRNHAQPRCLRTVDHLGAYLAGTLTTGQRARVDDHLGGCAACRDRLAEVEDLGLSLRRALVPAPLLAGALGWLRRRSGRGSGLPTSHLSPVGPGPGAGAAGASVALPSDSPPAGYPSTQAIQAAQSTGAGLTRTVSTSPTFQAVASLPVSAVAPLAAAGPTVRLILRAAVAVLALIPGLGGLADTDAPATPVATPAPEASAAVTPTTVTPTTVRPTAVTPTPPPAAAAAPIPVTASTAPPPLPATAHPRSTVAQAVGPTIDVFSPGGASPMFFLDNPQPSGTPLVFLVVQEQADWLEVLLPLRPNGSTGWVRRHDVTLSSHSFSLVIELSAHRITAFEGTEPFLSEPVGLGTSVYPTPGGLYYSKELIQPVDAAGRIDADGAYGPWAFGLSGFSEVLYEFAGGDGILGIHGTNQPSLLGQDVSHGCIRMSNDGITTLADTLPLGVPVEIRT